MLEPTKYEGVNRYSYGSESHQLTDFLEVMSFQPKFKLTHEGVKDLKIKSAVYCLFDNDRLVYVGKVDSQVSAEKPKTNYAGKRLGEHVNTISGRKGLNLDNITYRVMEVEPYFPPAYESAGIKQAQKAGIKLWNGGFGGSHPNSNANDRKPSQFDLRYPINEMRVCVGIKKGWYPIHELLIKGIKKTVVKATLCMKTKEIRTLTDKIFVPQDDMTFLALMQLVLSHLDQTKWQMTFFANHIALRRQILPPQFGMVLTPTTTSEDIAKFLDGFRSELSREDLTPEPKEVSCDDGQDVGPASGGPEGGEVGDMERGMVFGGGRSIDLEAGLEEACRAASIQTSHLYVTVGGGVS